MNGERIDICVCTFRRDSVVATLESLSRLTLPAGVSIHVIVADNDIERSAEARVRAAAADTGLEVSYIHAPAQNISIARNACLDTARSEWFAFLDDDEEAETSWLSALLAARGNVDVVFGYVRAVYPDNAPGWMIAADIHSTDFSRAPKWTSGYTCNVLIRRDAVLDRGLRFDPALGTVGGEDSLFFNEMFRLGGRYAYAPDAILTEEVPPARIRFSWLMRRRFRAGQTFAFLVKRMTPQSVLTVAALAMLKAGVSVVMAAALCFWKRQSLFNVTRAAFHLGVVSYSLSGRFYHEYRSSAL